MYLHFLSKFYGNSANLSKILFFQYFIRDYKKAWTNFVSHFFVIRGQGTVLGLVVFVWLTDDSSFWNVRPTRTMDSVPTSVPISLYCGYNEITVVTAQCWAIKLVTTYTNRTKETLKKQNKKQTLFGYESAVPINLSNFYLLKVNNRNTTRRYEICSELTIKTPEWHHWCFYR